jgi:hypothetical protein
MQNGNIEPNGHLVTSDLTYASFLMASGIIFVGLNPRQGKPSEFIFQRPSDELISSWQRGDDKVSARAFHEALRTLQTALRGERYG